MKHADVTPTGKELLPARAVTHVHGFARDFFSFHLTLILVREAVLTWRRSCLTD